ncbi:MAG: glycosyltransferase family 39 protein [Acidobacteriia bacterium]|nr:glycosyltransferase family 39 protein [Terriglobia bacterium]
MKPIQRLGRFLKKPWREHASPELLKSIAPADVAVLLALLVFGLMLLGFYLRVESFQEDSSYYMGLADSLIAKGRFEFDFKPHTQHPPGFPMILALVSLVFGGTYPVFAHTAAICGSLALFLAYFLLRRKDGRMVAAAACLLLGSSPFFFEFGTQSFLSELPFFLTTMLALLLASRFQTLKNWPARTLSWLLLVFCVLLSLLIRSAGLALLGGIGLWLAYSLIADRREARLRLKTFAPVLILGLGLQMLWAGWVKKVEVQDWPGQYMNTYANQMRMKNPRYPEQGIASPGDILHRAAENLALHGAHFSELLTRANWIAPLWYSPAVLLPIILLGLGCGVSVFRDRGDFLAWYFLCYVGIFLFWPFDPGPRAILPVFPLAFLYFWRGAAWFAKMASQRPRAAFGSGFLFSIILCAFSWFWIRSHGSAIGSQAKLSLVFWLLLAAACGLFLWPRSGALLERIRASAWSSRPMVSVWGEPLTVPLLGGLAGLLALVALGLFLQLGMGMANLSPDPSKFLHYPSVDAAQWIARNALPTDVVMAGQEAIVHRISGRRVILFPVSSNSQMIMDVLRNRDVRYLIVLQDTNKHPFFFPTEDQRWRSLSAAYPEAFGLVRHGPGYEIYQVAGEPHAKAAN